MYFYKFLNISNTYFLETIQHIPFLFLFLARLHITTLFRFVDSVYLKLSESEINAILC